MNTTVRMLCAGLVAITGLGVSTHVACAEGEALAPPAMYPATTWQGKGVAVVRVLDRLDAHVEVLSVPVGTMAHYKSLDITPGRCLQRPKTLSPDAAGWLELHDIHPNGATFKGWMLAAEPALGVLESAVYDVRMVRCEGNDVAPALPPLPVPAVPVLAQPSGPDALPAGEATGTGGQSAPAGGAAPAQGASPTTPEYGGEY